MKRERERETDAETAAEIGTVARQGCQEGRQGVARGRRTLMAAASHALNLSGNLHAGPGSGGGGRDEGQVADG